MRWRQDFHVGYSPERINPGDKEHTFTRIRKSSRATTPRRSRKSPRSTRRWSAPAYKAPSIRVAEAAKVIENTQRDLNIAFVNELAIIFEKLGLDTHEVLRAAGTKWNFLPFRPGLVGGHCIGVDPYYLPTRPSSPATTRGDRRPAYQRRHGRAHRAQDRAANDPRRAQHRARVNVLGLAFKEDVPDLRNSKVIDIVRELNEFGVETYVHDPLASHEDALHEYGLRLCDWETMPADALVLAVAHKAFVEIPMSEMLKKIVRHGCLVDVKAALDAESYRKEGIRVWRL